MNYESVIYRIGIMCGGRSLLAGGKGDSRVSAQIEADDSPMIHVVEETLHTHAGEDSPMVHAFEEALEKA